MTISRFSYCWLIFAGVLLFISVGFPGLMHAADWNLSGHKIIASNETSVTGTNAANGLTITVDADQVKLGVPSQPQEDPFEIRLDSIDLLPGGAEKVRPDELHVGPIVEFQHSASAAELSNNFNLRINIKRSGVLFRTWLRKWNAKTEQWDRIRSSIDTSHQWVSAAIRDPGIYAAFESTKIEEGVASWLRHKQAMVVAHNGYSLNSRIRVTNLETNKSIVVKIVSRGPYVSGRVIDLSYDAFKKIAKPGSGVVRVAVVPLNFQNTKGAVLGSKTITNKNVQPQQSSATADKDINTVAGVSARAYVALDVSQDTFVHAKNVNAPFSIASLTKLMTAVIVSESNVDLDGVMTYEPDDNADGSKIYMSFGEKIRVKDLFYASLVGSANNATKMLSRSMGLSKSEFVARMNAKAAELGLSTMKFVEPTGLEKENVGSAADYARLARYAFSIPLIQAATTKKEYPFTMLGSGKKHTIKNLNKLLSSGWLVQGTKTGYTEEARYCLAAQVQGKLSKKIMVVVVLGSVSDVRRYNDMDKILHASYP